MDHQQPSWEKIAKTFFRAPAAPSAFQTQSFVLRVMERLNIPEPVPLWERLSAPLMIPALGVGLAALLLSIALPGVEAVAPADVLFLTDVRIPLTTSLLLPPEPGRADALLADGLEEL